MAVVVVGEAAEAVGLHTMAIRAWFHRGPQLIVRRRLLSGSRPTGASTRVGAFACTSANLLE